MSYFYLDAKEFDKVAQTIEKYSDRSVAEQIINDYLANEGGKKIKEYIIGVRPRGNGGVAKETFCCVHR